MNYAQKMYKHFRTIQTHRKWVRYYCFKAGLYWQGLTHDLSKYSPTEFFESVKYYQSKSSPIVACKKDKGYSMAWFHHKGRNKHHYEYWMDNFDNGGENILMPEKYAIEMLCDFLGAARAYMKDEFSYEAECIWWEKRKEHCAMNLILQDFCTKALDELASESPTNKKEYEKFYFKKYLKTLYGAVINMHAKGA